MCRNKQLNLIYRKKGPGSIRYFIHLTTFQKNWVFTQMKPNFKVLKKSFIWEQPWDP